MKQPLVLLLCSLLSCVYSQLLPPPCESPIYCHGALLDTVQLARIFNDSKTFVDLRMLRDQNTTLANFDAFMDATGGQPTRQQIGDFVRDNFAPGDELEVTTPPDFNPSPSFLARVSNATVRKFAQDLVAIWPNLARRVRSDIQNDPSLYSFIPVANVFVIPGGRFKEYYYWDSYWVIRGLLVSEMAESARNMIDNFISIVKRYGFIPNGGRIYYLNRSQPPLLTAMAASYFNYSRNWTWLAENVKYLDKELKFWLQNKTVQVSKNGQTYTMANYDVKRSGPRPESYAQDVATASFFSDEDKKQVVYRDLKSGAESGWDFSTRWIFDANGGTLANLSYIQTHRVVPVDLNAFLCGAFLQISEMFSALSDPTSYAFWRGQAIQLRDAISQVLWNETDGTWYDYDIELNRSRPYFFPTNLAPLYSKCFEEADGPRLGARSVNYLNQTKVFEYLGGIPSSLDHSGEQWDFPNAWPPLQDIVVEGLRNSRDPGALAAARMLAERWVNANVIGFTTSGEMFEKYDAVEPGMYGGGGEYAVQSGFGWSNGVALKFIDEYYTNGVKK